MSQHPALTNDAADGDGLEAPSGAEAPPGPEATFDRTVEEGSRRLNRTWPGLLATGAVGGIDVSLGVLGLALVEHATGSHLLGSLAFGIGFIALTLANSELFTENFLVPIAAVVAGRSSAGRVIRLWGGTLVTNLVGGWVMMGLIVAGVPEIKPTVVALGDHFARHPVSLQVFAAAILGGAVITILTWMQHSTESVPAKLIAAVSAAFLLSAGSLSHAIVVSLEMFGALQAGAPFGYWAWARTVTVAIGGNIIGGVGLVTLLRLVQVGLDKIETERGITEQTGAGEQGPARSRQ